MKGKKLERPLHLDMSADEALARFIQTKPEEVDPAPGRRRKDARPEPGAPREKSPSSGAGEADEGAA